MSVERIAPHVAVGVAHGEEDVVLGSRAAASWKTSSTSRKPRRTGLEEELLLRAEEAEDVRLRDAGAAGDVLGGRAVQAADRELDAGRLDDLLAAARRALSGLGLRCHGL
jgi:hypothetical protein